MKSVKVGQLIQVPSKLLFPQRSGKYSRYGYSVGKALRALKPANSEGLIVECLYLESFRYTGKESPQIKRFWLSECLPFDGFSPIRVNENEFQGFVEECGCVVENGKLYDRYTVDSKRFFEEVSG